MTAKCAWYCLFYFVAVLCVVNPATAEPAKSNPVSFNHQAKLQENQLAAIGRHSTLLTVSQFGRYSVTAKSAQGTALQYVDRMAGPSAVFGKPGKQDGRLDLFLNQGEYKILTLADPKGTGKVSLQAHAFAELNRKQIPQLIKYKISSSSLDDFQQRSYWINIKDAQLVAIEAAGRNLADLRLWKDGNWLVDSKPTISQVYPDPHKPLQVCQLNLRLEPGLYLLTAYGGPSQPWTEDSKAHPLHIRYGIPGLDVSGQRRYSISVFGIDRYRVSGDANYFQLSLPKARPVKMTVGTFAQDNAFSDDGQTAEVTKKSIPPVTELDVSQDNGEHLVTIQGEAGQVYVLRHFVKLQQYSFNKSGDYWLSTIHSGAAGDSVDATSVLTQNPRFGRETYLDSRVIRIDKDKVWQRRFNLLDDLTLFFEVTKSGKYMLHGSGKVVSARYRIEPFLTSRPRDYESPPFRDQNYQWDLDAGFYVLTVSPERKGILTLRMAAAENIGSDNINTGSVQGSSLYGKISLEDDTYYTLYLNQQPGVSSGVVLRQLPLDLKDALPVTQPAGKEIHVPVMIKEQGTVRAVALDGKLLPVSVDSSNWQKALQLKAGRYEISVRNDQDKTISYALAFSPQRLAVETPLPKLPDSVLAGLPRYPHLNAHKPVFLDLDQNEQRTYSVQVKRPALYRLETDGLLETSGNLRTRTNPSLVRTQANGVGRNFLIQTYLRQGDYQVSIRAQGSTRGHLGLSMQQTPLQDGGNLVMGVVARAMMHSGQGLAYKFHVAKSGKYILRAMGVNRRFKMRLEDKDGWPVLKPNISADVEIKLAVGDYRLILLPEAIDARVVTLFEAVPAAPEYKGHGPFHISLNQNVKHVWLEPEKGEQRKPDAWEFSLPAPLDTTIKLNHDMQGDLVLVDDARQKKITRLSSGVAWSGELQSGHYRLSLMNRRHNNHVAYQFSVATRQLSVGQTRKVDLPTSIPVSIGSDNVYEFSSYGDTDVRARLLDAGGKVIARDDDYINDWNFVISNRLSPGQYQLQVEPLNASSATTNISLHSPEAMTEKPVTLPVRTSIKDNKAHIYPLHVKKHANLLMVQAGAGNTIGVAVEIKTGDSWQSLGSSVGKTVNMLVPIQGGNDVERRVRVWSLDRRNAMIKIHMAAYSISIRDGSSLASAGMSLMPLDGTTPGLAVGAVRTTHPGIFDIGDTSGVLYASQTGIPLHPVNNHMIVANSNVLWVARVIPHSYASLPGLRGHRLRLGERGMSELQMQLASVKHNYVDIESARGPVLLVADSRVGRAAVQLLHFNKVDAVVDSHLLAVSGHQTASAMADGRKVIAAFWNAGSDLSLMSVKLRLYRFKTSRHIELHNLSANGQLQPGQALAIALPAGSKTVRMVLPAHTAGLLLKDGRERGMQWSGDTAQSITSKTSADTLMLLPVAGKSRQFTVTVYSGNSKPVNTVSAGALYQASFSARGTQTLQVKSAANVSSVLRIRGSATGEFIDNSGHIRSGKNISLDGGGRLQLHHLRGQVLVWLDSPQLTPSKSKSQAQTIVVDKPASVALQGTEKLLILKSQEPRLVHLHSATALVTRLQAAGQAEQVEAYPDGVDDDAFIPAGQTQLLIGALGTTQLAGQLEVTSVAATEFKEGFGPAVMLPGGGSRLYKFRLEHDATVGIGVRASSDIVDARLIDSRGKTLGRGVVLMPKLNKGWYWLLLKSPANANPIQVLPVLVGSKPPGSGPPAEVIHKYLQRAGRKLDESRGEQ